MPHYIKVSQTASTNTYLSRLAATLPGGTVIYTPSQTAGRGQKGNSWESEDGKNLTFSHLLKRPPVNEQDNIVVVNNSGVASAFNITDDAKDNISRLPAVRYLLPIPEEAIARSSGAYTNYYGY